MNTEIRRLLETRQWKKAIAILMKSADKYQDEQLVHLSARFNSLNSKKIMGTINYSEESVETNQLYASLYSLASEIAGKQGATTQPIQQKVFVKHDLSESKLQSIMRKYRRSNKEIYQHANDLLSEYRGYKDTKSGNPSHDRSGLILKNIVTDYNTLLAGIEANKAKELDDIVKKVNDYISDDVPTWENIGKAYTLLIGRGIEDHYIQGCINKEPNDNQAKIECATRIENHLANIQ